MNKPLATIELVAVDGGKTFFLPDDVVARLDAAGTGRIALVEADDGSLRLEPAMSEYDRQMAIGRRIIREDHEILRALAQ